MKILLAIFEEEIIPGVLSVGGVKISLDNKRDMETALDLLDKTRETILSKMTVVEGVEEK